MHPRAVLTWRDHEQSGRPGGRRRVHGRQMGSLMVGVEPTLPAIKSWRTSNTVALCLRAMSIAPTIFGFDEGPSLIGVIKHGEKIYLARMASRLFEIK